MRSTQAWTGRVKDVAVFGAPLKPKPDGARLPTVCRWMVRVLLPMSVGILGTALHMIWSDSLHPNRFMDVAGTVMLGICIVSVCLWCFSAWIEGNSS